MCFVKNFFEERDSSLDTARYSFPNSLNDCQTRAKIEREVTPVFAALLLVAKEFARFSSLANRQLERLASSSIFKIFSSSTSSDARSLV